MRTGRYLCPSAIPVQGSRQNWRSRYLIPFYTTKPHGTGMGLRISRSIIESHNGHMWAEGVLGQGATFHLDLPITNSRPVDRSGRRNI